MNGFQENEVVTAKSPAYNILYYFIEGELGMKKGLKSLLKKSFEVDYEDTLKFPSTKVICEAVEKYCEDSQSHLEFVSKVTPIMFRLDDVLYTATVRTARGGYMIVCKEA